MNKLFVLLVAGFFVALLLLSSANAYRVPFNPNKTQPDLQGPWPRTVPQEPQMGPPKPGITPEQVDCRIVCMPGCAVCIA